MRVRSTLVIGILSTAMLATPALAWNGVQGGTGNSDVGVAGPPGRGTEAGSGRMGFHSSRAGTRPDVTAFPGGRVTTRRGFKAPAVDLGPGITSRGSVGGASSGGEDGNGSSGSSH